MMAVCFLCDTKLYGERTRVCSSITPHSNVPYTEKVAELLGEDFVVIVTPADHMCKKCTSLITHMDKLENDVKLVKNALSTYVQKKYGMLPPEPVKTLDVNNGQLKSYNFDIGQKKVSSKLNITSNKENSTLATPLKILKPLGDNSSAKGKMYKCRFCAFQSKELGHVRFHMRTHTKKEENANQLTIALAPIKAPPPLKKLLYRCQICAVTFDNRTNCLNHIQKNHNPLNASAKAFNNKASEELKLAIKSEKSQDEEQTETMAEVNDHQLDKGTINTDKNSHEETMKIKEETYIEKGPDEKLINGIAENNEESEIEMMESMLAEIHHVDDLFSDIEDTKSKV